MHYVGPFDVVVGHVARCPIYADLRQLDLFRSECMLIDVNDAREPRRPILKTSHRPYPITTSNAEQVVAGVRGAADAADTARSLHAESGHLPVGSRASLVDAVVDLPELHGSSRLEATIPLGDSESLQRLSQRTHYMTTRAAGSTALIDAELPDDR
jgi:hypothetical protein